MGIYQFSLIEKPSNLSKSHDSRDLIIFETELDPIHLIHGEQRQDNLLAERGSISQIKIRCRNIIYFASFAATTLTG